MNPAAPPTVSVFVPLTLGRRDRLASHAEELRLAGQHVVAEIIEGLVAGFDDVTRVASENGTVEP